MPHPFPSRRVLGTDIHTKRVVVLLVTLFRTNAACIKLAGRQGEAAGKTLLPRQESLIPSNAHRPYSVWSLVFKRSRGQVCTSAFEVKTNGSTPAPDDMHLPPEVRPTDKPSSLSTIARRRSPSQAKEFSTSLCACVPDPGICTTNAFLLVLFSDSPRANPRLPD